MAVKRGGRPLNVYGLPGVKRGNQNTMTSITHSRDERIFQRLRQVGMDHLVNLFSAEAAGNESHRLIINQLYQKYCDDFMMLYLALRHAREEQE
jgi:hypothetical protein